MSYLNTCFFFGTVNVMTSIKYYQTLSWLTSNHVAIRCHGDEKETVSAGWRTQYWLLLCLFILIFCCLYMGSNFPCPPHISTMSYYVSVLPESMSKVQKEIKHRVPPHLVSCGMKSSMAIHTSCLPLPRMSRAFLAIFPVTHQHLTFRCQNLLPEVV